MSIIVPPKAIESSRPRIFGIGLNKTGTRSFHNAMTLLGFKSHHWGGPSIRKDIKAAYDAGLPLLYNLDQSIDCFSDLAILSKNFQILDEQYPGSRFVMTVRPMEEWLDSRCRHVINNQQNKLKGEYTGNFLVIEEDKWRDEYVRHHTSVCEYFHGRDDFLEVDITAGEGWRPFCEFLGVPEPIQEFPHSGKGT